MPEVNDDILQTRPGQYVTRQEGGPGEMRQALSWILALFLVRGATVVAVGWAAFVLGPMKTGLALLVLSAVLLLKATQGDTDDPLDEGVAPNVLAVLLILLAIATAGWMAWGAAQLETVWPAPFHWRPYTMIWYWQLALLAPSLVWLSVRSLIDWRLSNEVTDPNWPAPINPRAAYYGPARPRGSYDVPPEGQEPPPPQPQGSLPRPVRWGENGARQLPRSEIEDALRRRLNGDTSNINPMTALESIWVSSPDGTRVRFADLVAFVRQIPNIGATYSSWQDRWDPVYWGAVVDTAAVFGIVSEREEKKKTRVLIEDWGISLRLLNQLLDGKPPH